MEERDADEKEDDDDEGQFELQTTFLPSFFLSPLSVRQIKGREREEKLDGVATYLVRMCVVGFNTSTYTARWVLHGE